MEQLKINPSIFRKGEKPERLLQVDLYLLTALRLTENRPKTYSCIVSPAEQTCMDRPSRVRTTVCLESPFCFLVSVPTLCLKHEDVYTEYFISRMQQVQAL